MNLLVMEVSDAIYKGLELAWRRVPGSDDLGWTGEVFAEEATMVRQQNVHCVYMRREYVLDDNSQCAGMMMMMA